MEKDIEAMKSFELRIGMLEAELNAKEDACKAFETRCNPTKENTTRKCRTKIGHYKI